MSYEVEVKYRLANYEQLKARLARLHAEERPAIVQEDTYLSHPAREFALTNEALRIRKSGQENRITYKGPKRSGPTKTREEIELQVKGGDDALADWLRLFDVLGFRPIATLRKRRASFHLLAREHALEISLDRTENLGDFAEIETIVERPNPTCRRLRPPFWTAPESCI